MATAAARPCRSRHDPTKAKEWHAMRTTGLLKRLAQTAVAAVLLTGLATVASPTAAHADARCANQYSGWFCLYDAKSYASSPYYITVCTETRMSLSQHFWDKTSSWRHRQTSGAWVEAYDWYDQFGAVNIFDMVGQTEDPDVSPFDNMMDSFKNHC